MKCDRCGRTNHTIDNCFATTDTNGYELSDSEDEMWECEYCGKLFDSEKGCKFHENVHCKKKNKHGYNNVRGGKYTNSKTLQSNCDYFDDSDDDY